MNNEKHELGTFTIHAVTAEEQKTELIPEALVANNSEESDTKFIYKKESISRRANLAIYGIGIFIVFLGVIDIALTAIDFWSIHWLLSSAFLVAISIMLSLSTWAVIQWVRGKDGIEVVYELQLCATELKSGKSTFKTHELLDQLSNYYIGTPHELNCTEVVRNLPDYLNDQERLERFEQSFLKPLDKKVEDCIQRYSLQTGTAVAASPIPTVDALLTLWRNGMMINEISAIYGVKPTLGNRIKVLGTVLRVVAYTGLSQGAMDFLDVSKIPYASLASKVLQGFGAGMATARIGHLCAVKTRPIPIQEPQESLDKILQSIRLLLGKRVLSRVEQAPIK